MYVDIDQRIYVAEYENHRIVEWKSGTTKGQVVAGGNGKEKNRTQLAWPTYIFVDEEHSVYVSDCNNYRRMRWYKGAPQGDIIVHRFGKEGQVNQLN